MLIIAYRSRSSMVVRHLSNQFCSENRDDRQAKDDRNSHSQFPTTSSFGGNPLIYVHNREQWPQGMLPKFLADCNIRQDFVNEDEERQLLAEVQPHLKRMRWEDEHWDDQIKLYREREQHIDSWRPENQELIRRMWSASFLPPLQPSPYVHILDLHQDGMIRPHLDKTRYCGRVISGLSLLSTSVMRMRHQNAELAQKCVADLLLNQRSLYRLSGLARYEFTHELLSSEESRFDDHPLIRERRIALISRELPIDGEGSDG